MFNLPVVTTTKPEENQLEQHTSLSPGRDGNIVIHETANLPTFLADDVMLEFKGNNHFYVHWDQFL